jgi:hypothetical protein
MGNVMSTLVAAAIAPRANSSKRARPAAADGDCTDELLTFGAKVGRMLFSCGECPSCVTSQAKHGLRVNDAFKIRMRRLQSHSLNAPKCLYLWLLIVGSVEISK